MVAGGFVDNFEMQILFERNPNYVVVIRKPYFLRDSHKGSNIIAKPCHVWGDSQILFPSGSLFLTRADMLKTWVRYSTPKCRDIVSAVLSSHPKGNSGVSTQEIYDLAIKQFPDAKGPSPPEKFYPPDARGRRGKIPMPVPEPPNRDHPIRSMRRVFCLSKASIKLTCINSI